MCKLDTKWLRKFNIFIEFIEVHKRAPKASEKYKGVTIGTWYLTQKSEYRKGTLKDERLVALSNICLAWHNLSEFNNFLSSTKIIKVGFGEISISKLLSGDELKRYLSLGISSVEDIYRLGYYNNNLEYCSIAFNKLFPYMEFYQARLLKDVYREEEFLKLKNLKRCLDINTQKEINLEIKKALEEMLPQRHQALKEVYIYNKSYVEGALSMGIGVHKFGKLVSWGIRNLRCSSRLKQLVFSSELNSISIGDLGYLEVLDRLCTMKENLLWYSRKEFIDNVKPLLSSVQLDSLGMSYRCTSNLKGAGIQTLDELLYYTNEELLELPNMGKVSLEEVNTKLEPLKDLLFCNRKIIDVYKKKAS